MRVGVSAWRLGVAGVLLGVAAYPLAERQRVERRQARAARLVGVALNEGRAAGLTSGPALSLRLRPTASRSPGGR